MAKDLPWEHFDIFLDVAGFRCWEAHNDLEEFFTVCLGLRNGKRSESLQVSSNPVLLLHGEPHPDQRLEQVYGVYAGHKALILAFPVDAADADAVGRPFLWSDRGKVSVDGATALGTSKLDKTSLRIMFILGPVIGHCVKVTIQLQNCLGRVHRIRVEGLCLSEATRLVQG